MLLNSSNENWLLIINQISSIFHSKMSTLTGGKNLSATDFYTDVGSRVDLIYDKIILCKDVLLALMHFKSVRIQNIYIYKKNNFGSKIRQQFFFCIFFWCELFWLIYVIPLQNCR